MAYSKGNVNACESESILPEVEELSEFHPDQLSSLVDIQKELEKLEARENVDVGEVMTLSAVDNVNVVDHEVTIVAEQTNEDITILPEISEIDQAYKSERFEENRSVCASSFNNVIDESLDIGETITIGTPNVCQSKLVDSPKVPNHSGLEKCKTISIKPTGPVLGQPTVSMAQLKAIRPLPEALKGKKPSITVAQPKKNVVTKVIFSPNSQAAPDAPIIFGEAGGQTIRIVGQNKTIITNSPKTITLAQAREMGLLSPGKMHHLVPSQSKGVIKKGVMVSANKTVTMVKSSPTKILPLPTSGQLHPIAPSPSINTLAGTPHKIFIRQSPSAMKSGTFSGTILTTSSAGTQGQILQIPVSQDNANNQIHQIQLPGKQVQYVRLVNSASPSVTTVSDSRPMESLTRSEPLLVSTIASATTSRPFPIALSTNVSNSSQLKMVPIDPAQSASGSTPQDRNSFERVLVSPGLSQLAAKPDAKPPANNIVMVPAEYVKQFKPLPAVESPPLSPKPIFSKSVVSPTSSEPPPPPTPPPPPPPTPPLLTKAKEIVSNKETVTPQSTHKSRASADPPNGIRPRKPCNCTKSQCLKLYCDCFANGEFCFQCNCNSCFNNLDHEEERQRAIKACLERNPNAFRPKIGKGYIGDERRHNKGCNCKRSGCLKNYCECYEAKISCSNNCKCIGCRNVEESKDSRDRSIGEGSKVNQQVAVKNKLSSEIQESAYKPTAFLSNQGIRQPFNLMTQEVVEATCQCLLAHVEGDGQLTEQVERLILEEFGRCLVEIIDCATRTTVNNAT